MFQRCITCLRVIKVDNFREWNRIPLEEKATSSFQSLKNKQCQRCFNERRTKPTNKN